ncbi:MAG: sugar ABC transporter permease, partial [Clostridia bacterium]|nr:sugar ABC transporter permease [Clostridia bacterium]
YWHDPTARWVMLLVFVVKNLGYMVIIFSGALAGMPKEYKEVFSLDSRSLFSYARRVIIPLLTPVIFFVVILSLINCFQIYREVFGLYGQYPPNSLYMLQNFMNNNFLKLNYHRLCSASFLVTMTIGLVVAVYLRVQDRSKRR